MKAMKARGKTKKTNGRFGRIKYDSKDSSNISGPDLAQLRKPIDINLSNLRQVTELLEDGSEEIKNMLVYECDIVYECRVCRSLFRSLANFISHKRVFCREKFDIAFSRNVPSNYHMIQDETFIMHPESMMNIECKENENIRTLRSQVLRKGHKKDLTSVVDMLQRKQIEDSANSRLDLRRPIRVDHISFNTFDDKRITFLESMESNHAAVYQTVVQPTLPTFHATDLMKSQTAELQNMVDHNTAVLTSDGHFVETNLSEKSDNPLQIYGTDDDDGAGLGAPCAQDLVCAICNAKFSTRKTLTCHMKSLHMSYRMCYPCPCCTSTFTNTWSVYRHLFKVHRKSNEQVRQLRAEIQEKAFRKETTRAEDLAKEITLKQSSNATDRHNNDSQEWMEHLEMDVAVHCCSDCGRRFDRRASLQCHSHFCQKRLSASNDGAPQTKRSSKASSPETVADNNNSAPKVVSHPQASINTPVTTTASTEPYPQSNNAQSLQECEGVPQNPVAPEVVARELSIRVEEVASLSNADWEMIGVNESNATDNIGITSNSPKVSNVINEQPQASQADAVSASSCKPDSPEIVFTSIDDDQNSSAITHGSKKRKVAETNAATSPGKKVEENNTVALSKSPINDSSTSAHESGQLTTTENALGTIANLTNLQCTLCRKKFDSMTILRRHMASHVGWYRFRCKLCDYKCFRRCECVAHCNRFHNAKNNRATIADMVLHIPQDQNFSNQDIVKSITNLKLGSSVPEIIDVTRQAPYTSEETNSNTVVSTVVDESNTCEKTVSEETKIAGVTYADGMTISVIEKKQFAVQSETEKSEKNKEPEKLIATTETRKENEVEEQKGLEEKDEQKKESEKNIAKCESQNSSPGKDGQNKKNGNSGISNTQKKTLDDDSDLRRMVMEVIFGLSESHQQAEKKSVKATSDSNSGVEKAGKEKYDKTNEGSINEDAKSKCSNAQDDSRPQRPVRNRVKPVDKDFIYDLKDVSFRKECAVHKSVVFAANRALTKKSSSQLTPETSFNSKIDEDQSSKLAKLAACYKVPSVVIYRNQEINSKYSVKRPEATSSTDSRIITPDIEIKEEIVCDEN